MAAMAAVTERLRFGTGICLVAQRDPIVTAKEVATLDHLSGGRFTFGIGFGWNVEELADHGVDFKERRDVGRERVLAMRRLWEDDEAEFAGEHVPSRALVGVAQAGAAAACRSSSAAPAGRSCSATSPSTPTAGCPSAGGACGTRCRCCTARPRRRAATRRSSW